MTYPLSRPDLRRAANFAVIHATCDRHQVAASGGPLTLEDVAKLCNRALASRTMRNLHQDRDRLIAIVAEWDLGSDDLRDQPDACIHELAALLREREHTDPPC